MRVKRRRRFNFGSDRMKRGWRVIVPMRVDRSVPVGVNMARQHRRLTC